MFQSARVGTSTHIFGKQSFIHNSDRAKKKKEWSFHDSEGPQKGTVAYLFFIL